MRYWVTGLIMLILISPACHAQTLIPQNSVQQNRAAIGNTLADDSDMYQRYVYDDAQTVGKQVALNLPVMPDADMQNWLIDRVAQIMSVTPTLYPTHKQKVFAYFTQAGWDQLMQQWSAAQIPQLIRDQNYTIDTLVTGTPLVAAKGLQQTSAGATYRWIVDVPVMLTYTQGQKDNLGGDAKVQTYNMSLRIGVTRIPMRENAQLIAIDQWGVTPPKPVTEPAATTP